MNTGGFNFKTVSLPEEQEVKEEVKSKVKSTTEFSPMLKFFKYENGNFEINKIELLLIPEAKQLIHNDRGGRVKGDHDGRKKLWAEKQFGVAWWIINVNSPGIQSGLEGKELFKDALKSLEIANWDYSKDEDFKEFVDVYKRMYNRASYSRMLKQVLMSFNDSADIIKVIRDNSVKILKSNKDLDADDIKILMSHQQTIINIASDIPKHIEKLKDLQELVAKEEKELDLGRGNVIITKSMIPNK
ncbi:hypothetical protein LCGC14_1574870 [marine sediment metagenome]|uniref:Uncharacterized protein n=1 Tax=marine sediment metagenome TaxID=412755 RepID=A0A0F9KZL7_9ZZZZ